MEIILPIFKSLKTLTMAIILRKFELLECQETQFNFTRVTEDGIIFDDKMQTLSATLSAQMQKASKLDEAIN